MTTEQELLAMEKVIEIADKFVDAINVHPQLFLQMGNEYFKLFGNMVGAIDRLKKLREKTDEY